jgi:hypothetical protein
MARANLRIDDSLLSAWNDASDSGSVRSIGVAVQGEAVVALATLRATEGDAWWADLQSQAAAAVDAQAKAAAAAPPAPAFASPGGTTAFRVTPLMWIVCVNPGPEARDALRFVLASWTPDGTHPRAKMLYASARDDIKRALGASRFEPDYHVSDLAELSAASFAEWRRRDREGAMTGREIAQAEVSRVVNSERSSLPVRVATMTKMAFRTEDDLKAALARFASPATGGDGDADGAAAAAAASAAAAQGWLEVRVGGGAAADGPASPTASGAGETLALAGSGPETEAAAVADRIAASVEPRFFLATPTPPGTGVVVLVYHCPESSKPKQRMLYSTAKAAVVEAAAAAGVVVGKVVETRDKDDVATAFAECAGLVPGVAAASAAPSAASSSSSTASTPLRSPGGGVALPGMFGAGGAGAAAAAISPGADGEFAARPTRPGRGAARLVGGMALPGMSPGALFGSPPA